MKFNNLNIYIKLILFVVFFSILLSEIISNISLIKNILEKNTILIFYILALQLFYFLIYNYRTFSVYKNFITKKIFLNVWSKFFFKSLIYNMSLNFLGTIYRAIILKRFGLKYEKFTAILYLLFFSYLMINFLFILLELFLFTNANLFFKLILIITFFLIFFFFIYAAKLTKLLFNKINLLSSYIKKIVYIINFLSTFYKNKLFNKKNIFNIFFLAAVLHLLEVSIFFAAYNIFFLEISLEKILILFAISFFLDRIPFLSSIVGSSEVIFGFLSIYFGLLFHEGILIKFVIRITGIITLLMLFTKVKIFSRANLL
jgi:hypothetical protein